MFTVGGEPPAAPPNNGLSVTNVQDPAATHCGAPALFCCMLAMIPQSTDEPPADEEVAVLEFVIGLVALVVPTAAVFVFCIGCCSCCCANAFGNNIDDVVVAPAPAITITESTVAAIRVFFVFVIDVFLVIFIIRICNYK